MKTRQLAQHKLKILIRKPIHIGWWDFTKIVTSMSSLLIANKRIFFCMKRDVRTIQFSRSGRRYTISEFLKIYLKTFCRHLHYLLKILHFQRDLYFSSKGTCFLRIQTQRVCFEQYNHRGTCFEAQHQRLQEGHKFPISLWRQSKGFQRDMKCYLNNIFDKGTYSYNSRRIERRNFNYYKNHD